MLAPLLSRVRRAIVAGPPTQYIVSASTYAPAAGANVTITAQLADAAGRSVHTAGIVVTWSKSDPGGSFSSATSTTDANGAATVTFTTSATPATACTVTATDATPYTGTSATITTGGSGSYTPDAFMSDILAGVYDGAEFDFYTGAPPRSTNMPAGGTLLGTLTFATPAATSSDLTSNSSTALHVVGGFVYVDGTVGWCRARQPDGTPMFDGLVGLSGSGRPFIVDDLTWVTGQAITATAVAAQTGT